MDHGLGVIKFSHRYKYYDYYLYWIDTPWKYYIECYVSVINYSHSDSGVYHPST